MQTSIFQGEELVSFGERLATSDQFKALFKEGMDLVAEAAAYLDGQGREDVKLLPSAGALAYAVESMRLTTRLMQLASWLLLQRAVNEGELTPEEASAEKHKVRLSRQDTVSNEDMFAQLPLRLCELVDLSMRVQARVIHFDELIYQPLEARRKKTSRPSPVQSLIDQLKAAFGPARI